MYIINCSSMHCASEKKFVDSCVVGYIHGSFFYSLINQIVLKFNHLIKHFGHYTAVFISAIQAVQPAFYSHHFSLLYLFSCSCTACIALTRATVYSGWNVWSQLENYLVGASMNETGSEKKCCCIVILLYIVILFMLEWASMQLAKKKLQSSISQRVHYTWSALKKEYTFTFSTFL